MRTLATLITAAVLAASSACTINVGEDEATETPSASVETSESPSEMSDERYAELVRENAPELRGIETSLIMEASEGACSALDAGESMDSLIEDGLISGLSPETVGTIVGGAIAHVCPEFSHLMEDAFSS